MGEERVECGNDCEEIVETDVGLQFSNESPPQISLNALTGINNYKTMRVKGYIGKKQIHILVDRGSTHNFLDLQTTKRLGCKMKNTFPLLVSVENEPYMTTNFMCQQLALIVGNMTYEIDVMVLPLGACEMVLGIQWLANLDDIKWNFQKLTMSFTYKNQGALMMCICSPMLLKMERKEEDIAKVESVVKDFEDVFILPTTLPPKRSHDHQIQLFPNSPPVNVRPYRHHSVQKDAIEQMVNKLLELGVIKHSQSPFSSPIIMVKKKDRSWRMCVDYKKINKSTIKDKFPILMIEELTDELNGAIMFSKLDLRSRYNQIRIKEADIKKTAFKTHDRHYEFLSKCSFAVEKVEYLGHVILAQGVATDPTKIQAIRDWPIPTNVKQLRGILSLSSSPVLALPNFSKEFMVEIDACGTKIGAVLIQEGHPIAYLKLPRQGSRPAAGHNHNLGFIIVLVMAQHMNNKRMATPMAKDTTSFEDEQFAFMSTKDIQCTFCLLDNEIRILKEELQRTNLELDSFKEKIKENQCIFTTAQPLVLLFIVTTAWYRLLLLVIFSAALHGWYYMVFVTTVGEEYDKVFNHLDMLNAPL
nr:hypothetical protein [Tanacetum cinerariifolium]